MLCIEPLERRELLSVSGIGTEIFKDLGFTATGDVAGTFTVDVQGQPVQISVSGTGTLGGTIVYTSYGFGLGKVQGGTISAKGGWKGGIGKGMWEMYGYVDALTDQNGQLTGSVVINQSHLQSLEDGLLNGPYDAKGFFKTSNFSMGMDITNADGYNPDGSLTFKNGTFTPTEKKAFDVVVTPSWSDNWVNVDVHVPGKVHKTKTADRSTPVTNIELYWAKGTSFSNKLGKALANNKIPVYWNEASGYYHVTGLPSAPAGATHLLFVAKFDRKTKVAALALPTVSVANASPVDEGNGDPRDPTKNQAAFTVTLLRNSPQPVTVWFTTLKGSGSDGAKPGVDYETTFGSIVIPPGETHGVIEVPIIGETTYERDEWFTVKLVQAQNAVVDKAHALAKGIIQNDDSQPSISINDVALDEGTKLNYVNWFIFTVTLSSPSYETIKVWIETPEWGTATPYVDYHPWRRPHYPNQPDPHFLTFAPWKTTAFLKVYVTMDSKPEEDETFAVHLYSAKNATISDEYGVGTILDDDKPGAQNAATSRDAALNELAGPGQLAAYFEPLGRKKNDKHAAAADLILAAT